MIAKPLTPRVERIIVLAQIEAHRDQSEFVGVKHLIIGMQQEGHNEGCLMMQEIGITIEGLRKGDWPLEIAEKRKAAQ